VFARLLVRGVDYFDIALSKNRELEGFPRGAFGYLFVELKYFER
jgi:hypothetical protein